MAENPITYIRRQLGGISRAELARRSGCDYVMLTQTELGYHPWISRRVLAGLERLGLPAGQARQMYRDWHRTYTYRGGLGQEQDNAATECADAAGD